VAVSLKLITRFDLTVNGVDYEGGSVDSAVTISGAGDTLDLRKTIGTTTTWDAWSSGAEEPLTDFDFMWVESELDGVLVEMTTDANAGVGREEFVVELNANIPFILGTDTGQANYTADFAAATADVIDQIRIRNPDGSSTAAVRLFLFS
jgi:hypothetical protein